MLGTGADEQTPLIEGKLEEPEVVFLLGALEEVHREPGVLLQGPGVGDGLLFDAHELGAVEGAYLAAQIEQLELGIGLGQEFGQGVDGGHGMRKLMSHGPRL